MGTNISVENDAFRTTVPIYQSTQHHNPYLTIWMFTVILMSECSAYITCSAAIKQLHATPTENPEQSKKGEHQCNFIPFLSVKYNSVHVTLRSMVKQMYIVLVLSCQTTMQQISYLAPIHVSSTCGLPGCIMRPVVTFVNYVYIITITQ
jgi:hypothetical protein